MSDIPDGGFTNSDQLKHWLNSLPEQYIKPFSVALATRSILRGIPFVATDSLYTNAQFITDGTYGGDQLRVLINLFRATLLLVVRSPNYGESRRRAA